MGEKKDYLRRYQFHRYQARPFRNPYFRRPGQHRLAWNRWLYALVGLGGLGLVVYLVGFLPAWMLTSVTVDGLQFISPTEVKTIVEVQLSGRRWLVLPARNRLFFSEQKVIEAIGTRYSFASLKVHTEGREVVVRATERISELLWQSGDRVFYTDEGGKAIRELSADDLALFAFRGLPTPLLEGRPLHGPYPLLLYLNQLPLVVNQNEDEVVPGGLVLPKGEIGNVLLMEKVLAERGIGIKRHEVERFDIPWARAITNEGFGILYDTTQGVEEQVGYLLTVLTKDVTDRSMLDYVDVRFGNHVYFKTK